jgi:hypothetical protein
VTTRPRARAVVLAGAVVVGLGRLVSACEDDPHLRTTAEQAREGSGGACEATAGVLPAPDCDNSDRTCRQGACAIDEGRCGSASTCLPTGDNRGKDVLDFRLRRLNIAAPPALASDFVQSTIVNLNIDLAEKRCGELGKGLFSWLLRYDRKAGTIVTGGAPPPREPFGEGFCFASFETAEGTRVEPVTMRVEASGETWRTIEPRPVNIPIFLSEDIASSILLPIRDARIEGVRITDDGNCIGRFNRLALDEGCYDDRALCSKWTTAGSIGGYITLEEADHVLIRDLANKSLCAFLAGEPTSTCARDGAGRVAYRGDYCSTDKRAGSCADAVWLAATFAGAAANIFDGKGRVPACSGIALGGDAGARDLDAGSRDGG